jgi:hypothetical protein
LDATMTLEATTDMVVDDGLVVVNGPELRREALLIRMEVKDPHLPTVVAVG